MGEGGIFLDRGYVLHTMGYVLQYVWTKTGENEGDSTGMEEMGRKCGEQRDFSQFSPFTIRRMGLTSCLELSNPGRMFEIDNMINYPIYPI